VSKKDIVAHLKKEHPVDKGKGKVRNKVDKKASLIGKSVADTKAQTAALLDVAREFKKEVEELRVAPIVPVSSEGATVFGGSISIGPQPPLEPSPPVTVPLDSLPTKALAGTGLPPVKDGKTPLDITGSRLENLVVALDVPDRVEICVVPTKETVAALWANWKMEVKTCVVNLVSDVISAVTTVARELPNVVCECLDLIDRPIVSADDASYLFTDPDESRGFGVVAPNLIPPDPYGAPHIVPKAYRKRQVLIDNFSPHSYSKWASNVEHCKEEYTVDLTVFGVPVCPWDIDHLSLMNHWTLTSRGSLTDQDRVLRFWIGVWQEYYEVERQRVTDPSLGLLLKSICIAQFLLSMESIQIDFLRFLCWVTTNNTLRNYSTDPLCELFGRTNLMCRPAGLQLVEHLDPRFLWDLHCLSDYITSSKVVGRVVDAEPATNDRPLLCRGTTAFMKAPIYRLELSVEITFSRYLAVFGMATDSMQLDRHFASLFHVPLEGMWTEVGGRVMLDPMTGLGVFKPMFINSSFLQEANTADVLTTSEVGKNLKNKIAAAFRGSNSDAGLRQRLVNTQQTVAADGMVLMGMLIENRLNTSVLDGQPASLK
jgi:hypothetical protein